MRFRELALPGLFVIEPDDSADEKGAYASYFAAADFVAQGLDPAFVQEHSSRYFQSGTVRGLHFQKPPFAQNKLVRVARGRIYDAVVDIRRDSPSFGLSASIELSAETKTSLYVPIGFAHGFCTLAPDTEVVFKLTHHPNTPGRLGGVLWNDPSLGIAWPCGDAPNVVFPADAALPPLAQLDTPFGRR